ncbi:MAG: hypothetical protein KJ620_04595 [Candidatus Edwardsbacteria bacterium]|nr:hypothetical protein [Candidatus Edwardsbacteria bacterium]MBU1575797.1 hypothetical protein [Candidatus Edwardsbacteria bacterium]MBU2463986.1 hypothetical protein [Candidatus Edwardsbacteria bacterium]MBU2593258.1 hypothetical protein [Candidatus Edwardsbacteria bacterium]
MRSLAGLLCLLIFSAVSRAEDYSFEVPPVETQKETLELSGQLDARYSLLKSRKNSPLYSLQYVDRQLSDVLTSCRVDFYLNGDYRTEDLGVHVKTQLEYFDASQADFGLYELYGNVDLPGNSFLLLGQKMFNWGKGYAFNPVGYVNPQKDPENPELAQSGILSMNYQYTKSFSRGALNNLSMDLILAPAVNTINGKIAEAEKTDLAAKIYFLLWDTDIDLMGYFSRINPKSIGFDFSRNILSSLEIHGEFSSFANQSRYYILQDSLQTDNIDGSSYLIGLRWLNRWNITTIAEYYLNDAGLSGDQFEEYNAFLVNAAASGDNAAIASALSVSRVYFGSSNLMREYLYLKASWPEPFNWLYFTPAVQWIYNLEDRSSSVGVPVSYKPITNFELVVWPSLFAGKGNSEYGSKQYESKVELWAKFYF